MRMIKIGKVFIIWFLLNKNINKLLKTVECWNLHKHALWQFKTGKHLKIACLLPSMTYGLWLAWCRLLYAHCKEHKQFKNIGALRFSPYMAYMTYGLWLTCCHLSCMSPVCNVYIHCNLKFSDALQRAQAVQDLVALRFSPSMTYVPRLAFCHLALLSTPLCQLWPALSQRQPLPSANWIFSTLNFLMIALWAVETFDILAADDVAVGLVGPLLSHGRENQSSFD